MERTPDDGDVVDEDSQEQVARLGGVAAAAEAGAEAALVLTEAAFYLPALAVSLLGKASAQLSSISSGDGVWTPVAPWASANSGGKDACDAEGLPAEFVRRFALVAGVAQEGREPVVRERRLDGGEKLGVVRSRPAADDR